MVLNAFKNAVGNARLVKAPSDELSLTLGELEEVLSYINQLERKVKEVESNRTRYEYIINKQEATIRFLRGCVGLRTPNLMDFA